MAEVTPQTEDEEDDEKAVVTHICRRHQSDERQKTWKDMATKLGICGRSKELCHCRSSD